MERFNNSSFGGGWGFPGMGGQQTNYASQYSNAAQTVQSFWQQRAENVKRQILEYLNGKIKNEVVYVTVKHVPSRGDVKLNTLKIEDATWSDTYPSELPLTIQAAPQSGYIFTGWTVTGAKFTSGSETSLTATIQPEGEVTITANYTEGSYTKADAQKLMAYLLNSGTLTESEAKTYDLDGSGTLNARDLTLLKRIAGNL